MGKVTRNHIDGWFDRLVPGTKLVCTRNDRDASRVGITGTVDLVSRSVPAVAASVEGHERRLWISPPSRVRDWVAIEEGEATYLLDPEDGGQEIVGWKIEG